MNKIFVTKSFLPPKNEYLEFVDKIWDNGQLTNQGILLQELEQKLKVFLQVENLHYVTNGTIAIQLAFKALGIESGEIITTPFSYVATTSSILWERCTPIFVDIEPNNYCIDPDKIEALINKKTKAILAVHVFGYPCNVIKIEEIAKKYNLKVIYDSAHAFGSSYLGKSLLSYGDISTVSFHATKLFHTVEGGACIVNDKNISNNLDLIKRFGHNADEHVMLGINGKQSEFHAAMGLANFPYISQLINIRKRISEHYDALLDKRLMNPLKHNELEYNYAYYPVLFRSESELLNVFTALNKQMIYPRRYFYPSLNKLQYLKNDIKCPISEDISLRIACLPLYTDLTHDNVDLICQIINGNLLH
ncbi:dTDP-4-amino-4,6-dideoxygalactose transaminase [Orbus hercynius]|uniref:dTDP-4-amino-4,6-dideoxygalactose transaminase n=1 Tax=Orbus hercynius TaxID=593135 RepID=A0A495RK46_9GAMM|nr:DegT/DnrJ/EryC1/StrS family aminotransferase [Orbus hercynius]RKS87701.1 dTDP-4-amino-4,6-dideoxygalactose transaminase [Orbus hercynius]